MAIFKSQIPQGTDILSVSQGDLLGNDQWMPLTLGKDHQIASPNSNSSTSFEGRHIQVSLNDRGGLVAMPGDGTEGLLFHNQGNLYWRNSNSNNPSIQMTTNVWSPSTVATFGTSNGWSFLPGAILMQWGQNTRATDGAVTFPQPFPNNVFSVVCTLLRNNDSRIYLWVKSIPDLTQFIVAVRDATGNDVTLTFKWIAIGN